MHGQETIVRYLQDAEAAERNFEDALEAFSNMGDQTFVQRALRMMSAKAKTQHEKLETRLKELGAGPSTAKSALAHILGFAPTAAQMGQSDSEKNTQHLIATIAAAAAETAMYQALGIAAHAAHDVDTQQLAEHLQQDELEDYRIAAGLLRESALDSFHRSSMDKQEALKAYLQDAIAAEKNFETQLRGFAKEGSGNEIHALFLQHADETKRQYERLTRRLEEIGGSPSTAKTFIAHLVGMSPKLGQVGHDVMDRLTQDLIITFAVENCEVAMYEALIAVAEAVDDTQSAELARSIQAEERATAEKVWQRLSPTALSAFNKMSGKEELAHR